MHKQSLLPLALTCGDPASISGELTLKVWQQKLHKGIAPFVYIGDANHLQNIADKLQLNSKIQIVKSAQQAPEVFDSFLPVIHQPLSEAVVLGQPSSVHAARIISSIETAVKLTKSGQCRALVTNPIAKNILYEAGFKYPGHTEFLEHLANKDSSGQNYKSVMMLACSQLKVVPITIHIPLMQVSKALTSDLIYNTVKIVANDLKKYFNIQNPRLALTGLNPHAGEGGAMGNEDINIIKPAINKLKADGYNVTGPTPADTMFHSAARAQYDVAFGMYHDQALIPIKTLDFDKGVNVTLGLPFIRTSPDHGTAFDIAGKNLSRPHSLIAALKLAHKMANNLMVTNGK